MSKLAAEVTPGKRWIMKYELVHVQRLSCAVFGGRDDLEEKRTKPGIPGFCYLHPHHDDIPSAKDGEAHLSGNTGGA